MALSQRDRRLLVIPVALAGALAFYNWVHEPLFARRAEAADLHDKVAADLKRDQSRLAKEGNLKARKEAVAAREKVIDAWVPGKNSAALFIWYLSQAEMQSGARIKELKVSDRKEVQATPQKQPGTQGQNGQGTQGQGAQGQTDQAAKEPADLAPTLTVITLELKANARFAQHMLFNQALEEMPLFLNTDALSIERDDKSDFEEAGKLVKDGNPWLATKILQGSPDLGGKYLINLYFKGDKVGPTTDPMQFAAPSGRVDPFVRDGIEDFIKTLIQYYNEQNKGSQDPNAGSGQNNGNPPQGQQGSPAEQMG